MSLWTVRVPWFSSSIWVLRVLAGQVRREYAWRLPVGDEAASGGPRLLPGYGAVDVALFLERDDQAKRVGFATAMLRNDLAPPLGGHRLGAAELDEGPLSFIFERLLSPAGALPLPRPPGRCRASDRGL